MTVGIKCSWCNKPIRPNAARMRMHESESIRFSGTTLAHFHPECGDELLDYCENRARTPDKGGGMMTRNRITKQRPTRPGWYWYELPGHWPLQPALVFDGGPDDGLMYTTAPIDLSDDDSDRDGLFLSEANENALWSTEPIIPPDRQARDTRGAS